MKGRGGENVSSFIIAGKSLLVELFGFFPPLPCLLAMSATP